MKYILYIDSSKADTIKVSLIKDIKQYARKESQQLGSQVLLGLIEEVINEAGITMQDLSEVKVNTGPGSFTGIKVGVSIANALAYVLKIPVNGKKIETDLNYNS